MRGEMRDMADAYTIGVIQKNLGQGYIRNSE
jgi:hypothetical protein